MNFSNHVSKKRVNEMFCVGRKKINLELKDINIVLRKLPFNSYIKVVGYSGEGERSLCCIYLLAE